MRSNILLIAIVSLFGFSAFSLAPSKTRTPHQTKVAKEMKFTFKVSAADDVVLPEGFADTLKKAEAILSKIFSSDDFKQALYKRSFADSSFSNTKKTCFERIYDDNGRVSGRGVYENLTRNSNVTIDWVIKKYKDGEKTSVMGFSTFCVNKITSHDYWIKNGQYLSLRFVRHLAHEYTHVCGYKHDKLLPKEFKFKKGDDPAMGVGGIVGDIMLDWTKKGLI